MPLIGFSKSLASTRKLLIAGLFAGMSFAMARTWASFIKTLSDHIILRSKGRRGGEDIWSLFVSTVVTTIILAFTIWLLVIVTGRDCDK